MTALKFKFYELSDDACEQLQLAPLLFPARSNRATSVFENGALQLKEILEELDIYLKTNPDQVAAYAESTARLAMIQATNQIHAKDSKAAKTSLEIGLRADPENNILKLHYALVLQMLGDNELAVYGYEALLDIVPYTFDPVIRSLAAKAYAAIGQEDDGLKVLEGLPEEAFADASLQALRLSMMNEKQRIAFDKQTPSSGEAVEPDEEKSIACISCDNMIAAESRFCSKCGTKNENSEPKKSQLLQAILCSQCGATIGESKKFCSSCGSAR